MGYDVRAIRAHFPALAAGAAHFDGPGGSQVPDTVAAAVADTLLSPLANRGSVTAAERAADAVVLAARAAMGDLLGVDPRGVVFGRSMTALTFDLARTLAATWGPDDEVIVTRLDHDANIRPWIRAAEAVGAAVRFADFDPRTAELTVADVARELSSRTRVVAVTGASNLLGTRPPVPLIAAAAHERGALVVVDGVHLTAHAPVDVAALGADFYACSPYKFLGPHCGVLAAAPDLLESLSPEKLVPSPDSVPERFELGTLPYELLAGTTAAVDFLAGLDRAALEPRDGQQAATADGEPDRRRAARGPAAAPHRGGARGAARRRRALPRRLPDADAAALVPRARPAGRLPVPRGARRQRPRRHLLRAGGLPAARVRRPRLPARRPRPLHRRRRRRPPAGCLGRVPRRSVIRGGVSGRTTAVGTGNASMTVRETERKYESAEPPGAELIAALAAATGGAAPAAPTRIDLSATYWDTADLRLLRSRLTLRRRVGGDDAGWHLKLPAGADSRDEVRRPLGRARKPPAPLVALSRAAHRDAPLRPVVELDTVRQEWTLTDAQGEAVATVTDDRVTARTLGAGSDGGTAVDTEPLEWAEIEVELAGQGTPEVLDRIEDALLRAGVHRSASASKLGRVLAERVPPGPPRPVASPDATAGEVVLAYVAEQAETIRADGSAGPPRRPGGGARHARGLPADAQHLPVLPRAARPQPDRRPRRGAALARG